MRIAGFRVPKIESKESIYGFLKKLIKTQTMSKATWIQFLRSMRNLNPGWQKVFDLFRSGGVPAIR